MSLALLDIWQEPFIFSRFFILLFLTLIQRTNSKAERQIPMNVRKSSTQDSTMELRIHINFCLDRSYFKIKRLAG